MGATEETLGLLRSIDASLKQLVASSTRAPSSATAASNGAASDADLDHPTHGDPTIKWDPKRWTGPSMVGKRYSETSPDYLQSVADFATWRAQKDDESKAVDDKGRPKSYWAHKDRGLALGWAARLRAGWKPAAAPAFDDGAGPGGDTDPFDDDSRFPGAF